MRGTVRRASGSPRQPFGQSGEKGGFKEAFTDEIIHEIETLIGPGAADRLDFEAFETALRHKTLSLAARAAEQRFNADLSDHIGAKAPCPKCGKDARYAGRREKTFTTVLGEMTLSRAYYDCADCKAGFCPRDRALGIEGGSLSPHVLRMVGIVASRVSFEEGHDLIGELAGIEVPTKQVEREAERLGREIAEDERKAVEPETNREVPPTLYLGMDGTGIPMRKNETEGRTGKQPDGSSKTREVKLCTVWSAEKRDNEGVPVRDEGSITYTAAIESAATRDTDDVPSEFAARATREALRRRFEQAGRHVVLGDGAPWIWNLATEQFPGAIQIVDRYHANEHISAAAKVIYGTATDLHKEWAHQRCTDLKAGKLDAVLAALDVHASIKEVRDCRDYIQKNRDRMRYGEFHAAGLCTSTAVLESGCKRAIGLRLKQGGMFWTLAGANAIIALRCCHLSGRFEDFWERRSSAWLAA